MVALQQLKKLLSLAASWFRDNGGGANAMRNAFFKISC